MVGFSWGQVFVVLDMGIWKEWYLVRKEEGVAGSVLGGGSFLRREAVSGARCLVKKLGGLEEGLWCLEEEGA